MMTASELTEGTTERLFESFEKANIPYAVLRNYEDYPNFRHDIDITLDAAQIELAKKVLVEVARESGWEALVECDHWNQSPYPHHNIHIFKLYNSRPLAYLQLDIFQSLLVLGTPLFESSELIGSNVTHEKGFRHIHPSSENIFRLLQVHSLCQHPGAQDKVQRYRDRIMAYDIQSDGLFRTELARHLGTTAVSGWNSLATDDVQSFRRLLWASKYRVLFGHSLKNPRLSATSLLARIRNYVQLFLTRQCGFILPIHAPSDEDKKLCLAVIDQLIAANLIYCSSERKSPRKLISWAERKVMERGGLVVKWVPASEAWLTVLAEHENESVAEALVRILIDRHIVLFRRECAPK